MLVFGQFNAENVSLSEWSSNEAALYVGTVGKITYRAGRADWTVLSGDDGKGHDFYIKVVRNRDAFVIFQIQYPAQKAGTFRPVVQRLAKCFAVAAPPL